MPHQRALKLRNMSEEELRCVSSDLVCPSLVLIHKIISPVVCRVSPSKCLVVGSVLKKIPSWLQDTNRSSSVVEIAALLRITTESVAHLSVVDA